MTRYKITYTLKGSTESITGSIVERDENRAKKFLKTLVREEGNTLDTIISIEIEVENIPASKRQEREALEEIKAIVDSLGEESYLKTAFAGCFEDAENNIDDDAAYSMKDRWESAEQKLAAAKEALDEQRKALEERESYVEVLKGKIETMQAKILDDDAMADFQELVSETIYTVETSLKEAAEAIVKNAENPASEEFRQAVIEHRALTSRLDYFTALRDRIVDARQA